MLQAHFLRGLMFFYFYGVWSQLHDFIMDVLGMFGKKWPFAGRQVVHFDPLSANTDSVEYFLSLLHPFSGPEVAGFKMTVTFNASDNAYTVGAFFKCPQEMNDINFAGTGHPNNFDTCWIGQSHGTCQVRSRITSVTAAKRENNRIKILTHITPSSKASTLHNNCSSSYQFNSIAFAGHSATHAPQPWHNASSISLTPSLLITGTL